MDSRIRFGNPIEPVIPMDELPPADLITTGDQNGFLNSSFRVYLVESVLQKIWEHVHSSPRIECGGVIVGHPFKSFDKGITYVVVTGFIPQTKANQGIAHFTVGPDEVSFTRELLSENYPGLVAVGWYHSHPGHGVFLSGQDMTIVRSIYNLDWHLAMVLDPSTDKYGIFVGPEGNLTSSIVLLSKEPDIVIAIALYNQFRDFRDRTSPQSQALLNKIATLVSNSKELEHWTVSDGYRGLFEDKLNPQLKEKQIVNAESSSHLNKTALTPQNVDLPLPARKERTTYNTAQSLLLVFSPAVVFSLLALIGGYLLKTTPFVIVISLGISLSIFSSYGVMLLFSSEKTQQSSSNKLLGTLLLIVIMFAWLLVVFLGGKFLNGGT